MEHSNLYLKITALMLRFKNTVIWGKILLVGGGPGCQLHYRHFIRQITDAMEIRPLPEDAFALSPSSPLDWVDSTESQGLLNYQNRSFEDFIKEMKTSIRPVRILLRLFGPLIRRSMLKQSPFLK